MKCDKFTANLVNIAARVYVTKRVYEDIRLHLLRNDFLPTDGDTRVLQVEINTVSAGFAGVLESLSQVHLSNRAHYYPELTGDFPINLPCTHFASAIHQTVLLHNERWGRKSNTILFIIEEGERNVTDQFALELRLVRDYRLTVIRRSLGKINPQLLENHLFVDGLEVPLVYFRSGYDPKHYPSGKEWEVRELIEKSRAVKCPTVLGQLAGTKKVQQLWCTENMMQFGLSSDECETLQKVFAVQTDPSVDEQSRITAIDNPTHWVLKPQREGGGNNMYGQDMISALETLDKDELSQFVLMEKMIPVPQPALAIDGPKSINARTIVPIMVEEAVSEIGIYSYYIPAGDINQVAGHLVRTKEKNVSEGGVNSGFSSLDTLHLV